METKSPTISRELRDDLATVDARAGVPSIATSLGIKTLAGVEFIRFVLANSLLMDRKQQDYGSQNITEFGIVGTIVRMSDKRSRLNNLIGLKGEIKESVKNFISNCSLIEKNQLTMSQLEIMTRLNTDIETLKPLFSNRRRRAANESIYDSFRDIGNYSTIALMVEFGRWPSE